jgi:hypothetical protein
MIEKDKTTMLESLESKLKNALDNMSTQTSDYIKGRFEEWEAKYVANDTKIEKHNENLKNFITFCCKEDFTCFFMTSFVLVRIGR